MNDSRFQLAILAGHLALGVIVVAAATTLGVMHDLNGEAVTAIYGSALGFAGGGAAAGHLNNNNGKGH